MTDEEFTQKYESLGHAIQTGVAHELALEAPAIADSPVGRLIKHLRTGNNLRACDHAALAHLLIAKGVITDEEYKEALLKGLKREKESYERSLTERLRREPGANPDLQITLV